MDLGLKGKRALVTGGASGIGRAIVSDLAREGVFVAFTSRDRSASAETLEMIGGEQAGHRYFQIDIAAEGAPDEVFTALTAQPVDIVVNNVGSSLGITDPQCSTADWKRLYRLNLEVHVEVNNLFIPQMKERQWGRIVNITAGAAMENSGPVPYCSMKAAYTAYTRSMARVLAPTGIVMSAVMPGVVLTEHGHWQQVLKERPEHAEKYLEERTALKRFGLPGEISPLVVLLCSELASFCVGTICPVDGGQSRHFYAGNVEVLV